MSLEEILEIEKETKTPDELLKFIYDDIKENQKYVLGDTYYIQEDFIKTLCFAIKKLQGKTLSESNQDQLFGFLDVLNEKGYLKKSVLYYKLLMPNSKQHESNKNWSFHKNEFILRWKKFFDMIYLKIEGIDMHQRCQILHFQDKIYKLTTLGSNLHK